MLAGDWQATDTEAVGTPRVGDVKELGRTIKRSRLRMGLTQDELGKRVGRTHGTISNLELGRTDRPPVELLTAIALELGDRPEDYIRLAGRAVLTAADVIPADRRPAEAKPTITLTPDELEELLERAASRAIQRLREEEGRAS